MDEFINFTDKHYQNIKSPSSHFKWRVRKQPVYRLLDNKRWLDNFFNDGEIALSCLSNFRKYPNEIQGDSEEGDAMVWFEKSNGGIVAVKYESGINSYILCTSLDLTTKIIEDFNAVGAIKIHNPEFFGVEIMAAIGNCRQGIEGNCIYKDNRVYRRVSKTMQDILDAGDHSHNPIFLEELQRLTCEEELFLKHKKYEYQNEYRLLWFMDSPIDCTRIVKCPEAIRHCERIDF